MTSHRDVPGDPATWSAGELRAAYQAGELSPVQVEDAVQARIARWEPTINALATHHPERSAAQARESEKRWRRGEPLGPLDGVPVTVKENIPRVGVPSCSGCAGVRPTQPVRDAPVVERLRESGAVLLGSTTMPDFGMLSSGVSSLRGITRSPLDPNLTAGGSSAGAGAATAAAYGPIHVGTDIGGSIRLPGTWLGVVGLKPSFGRVPLDSPYPGRVAGPLTRSAADAALAMAVLSRPDERDWSALPPEQLEWPVGPVPDDAVRGLRVGLLLDAGAGIPCDAAVRELIVTAATLFEGGGAKVEPLAPWLTEERLAAQDLFWRVRSWNDVSGMPPPQQDLVLPYVRRWAERGAAASGVEVLRAYQSTLVLRAETVSATAAYDLVLSPVAPMAAFPAHWPMPWGDADEGMGHIGFTLPFSISGQPSCSVNAGHLSDGRTVGLQISGRRFDDVGVLRAVQWFESARPVAGQAHWPT